jgi:uncharacterized protein
MTPREWAPTRFRPRFHSPRENDALREPIPFAGSKTRLLADMTGDPARAFWKLGERHFLGPIPRADFTAFLRRGFEAYGHEAHADALDSLLDLAEKVP